MYGIEPVGTIISQYDNQLGLSSSTYKCVWRSTLYNDSTGQVHYYLQLAQVQFPYPISLT
jgi:hypothetical protein